MQYGPPSDRTADPAHGFEAVRFEMGDSCGRRSIRSWRKSTSTIRWIPIADVLRWRLPLLNKTPLELMGVPEQVQFLIHILGIVGSLPSDSNAGGYLDLTPYFGGTPRPGSTGVRPRAARSPGE